MPCEEQDEYECSHHDTVPAESLEPVLGDEVDKELDGKQGYDEGHHIAYEQCRDVVGDNFRATLLDEVVYFIYCSTEHSGHGKEEGELGCCLAGHALSHTTHDSSHRTRHTRYHGDAL